MPVEAYIAYAHQARVAKRESRLGQPDNGGWGTQSRQDGVGAHNPRYQPLHPGCMCAGGEVRSVLRREYRGAKFCASAHDQAAGVAVSPGATQVTAIPSGPCATASARARATSALAGHVRQQIRGGRRPDGVGDHEDDPAEAAGGHAGHEGLGEQSASRWAMAASPGTSNRNPPL